MSAGNSKSTDTWVTEQLMRDFSLTKEQASGIAGNLSHESANFKTLQEISPVVKGSRGGYGWAQWTGPRRRDYEAYAAKNGLDPASKEANYGFLKHELTNTPERRVIDKIKGTSTPEAAAKVFSDTFLRPGIPHMSSRKALASDIFGRTAMPNMMDTGGYFNDLAPDLMAYTKPRPNPDFQPVPVPKSRASALANVDNGSINVAQGWAGNPRDVNAYFSNVPTTPEANILGNGLFGDVSGNPSTPSQSSIFMSNRAAGLPSGGFSSAPDQGFFSPQIKPNYSGYAQRSSAENPTASRKPAQRDDGWSMPVDIQNASFRAREALGVPDKATQSPIFSHLSAPQSFQQNQSSSYGNTDAGGGNSFGGIATGQSESLFAPSKSYEPGVNPMQSQRNSVQQYKDVVGYVDIPNPAYSPVVPSAEIIDQMMNLPMDMNPAWPTQPQPVVPAVPKTIKKKVVNKVPIFSKAPAAAAQPSLTRAQQQVFGSGGYAAGQNWRDTGDGGARMFNPSTRQYENYGGNGAGSKSSNQSTGSGGSLATLSAIADKVKSDFGGGSSGSGGKIVCTAMNKRYGFGGFRNAIWLKYASDNLTPYHERGYHAIFQPLVNFGFGGDGKARSIVRTALEHIARERTADIWAEMRGTKRRALGRSYRAILEPVCWLVGKLTTQKQVT